MTLWFAGLLSIHRATPARAILNLKKKLISERERKGEGERNIALLFHFFMHSLVDSCMCPDWGSNLQPWCVGTTLVLWLSYLAGVQPLTFFFFFFLRFYLFFRERGMEGDRKGEKHLCKRCWLVASCLLHTPDRGPGPCALTGSHTCDLLVCWPALNPLSHTSQGQPLTLGIWLHTCR